jgi:hypothetical protein
MAYLNGLRGRCIVLDFDKSKTSRLAREPIPHDGDGIHRNSMIGKEILNVRLIGGIGKISHEQLFHVSLLL